MNQQLTLTLSTTAHQVIGGIDAVAGIGEDFFFTFGYGVNQIDFNRGDDLGAGDKVTYLLTDQATNYQTQVGAGNVTGKNVNYCLSFQNKIYALSGGSVFCSAIDEPTQWNDPNASGNGVMLLQNWYSATENLVSMATYQGRMVFFSRRTAQIWQIDPDINNWALMQVFPNTGALAQNSVQSVGELDVLFLSDTGIRSLRARDAVLNAYVTDIGSPVDALVGNDLLGGVAAGACSIIEPTSLRYWCYIPTTPQQAMIPGNASYDGSGQCTVYGLTLGGTYKLTLGANDSYATCGDAQITTNGSFVAQDVTLYMTGTANQNVTAKLVSVARGSIYVLSYFPSNKIVAWSQYIPSTMYALAPNAPEYYGTGPGNTIPTVYINGFVDGRQYVWIPSSNEQSMTYNGIVYTTQTFFTGIAGQGAAITGNPGTIGQFYTGTLYDTTMLFSPQKFVIFEGQVWARDEDTIYQFGGGDNNTYDYTAATATLPWLDLGTPGARKQGEGIDAAFNGAWIFSVGMDQYNETLDYVWVGNHPTFQFGAFDYSNEGTHFSMQAVAVDAQPASLASLIFHYNQAGEK